VRLVKGAYWTTKPSSPSSALADPRVVKKTESTRNYEKLSLLLLENIDIVFARVRIAQRPPCAHAIAQAERRKIDPRAYEFQALYGMAGRVEGALLASGHRVREYCAIGELLPGWPTSCAGCWRTRATRVFFARKISGGNARAVAEESGGAA